MEKALSMRKLWLTSISKFYLLNGYHYQNTYGWISYLFTRITKIVSWVLAQNVACYKTAFLHEFLSFNTTFLTIQYYFLEEGENHRSEEWCITSWYQLVACVLGDRRISLYLSHYGGGVTLGEGRGYSWNNHSPKKHSYTGALTVSPSPLRPPIT